MSKDALKRIDDTISFVENHQEPATVSNVIHAAIVKTLKDWRRLTSEATREVLSDLMSLNNAQQRAGDETGRAYARTAILIKSAIVLPETQWVANAAMDKAMPGPYVDHYRNALMLARDYIHSTPESINAMLGDLRNNPLAFLGTWKLIVNGGNKAGNPIIYKVAMVNGAYSFDCYGTNGGRVSVAAVNVRATAYATISANPGGVAPVNSAAGPNCDLMLTTQFTGCSFCFMKNPAGTNLMAAHIDPVNGSGTTGQQVSAAMRGGGGFANGNGGVFRAYGRVADASGLYGYPQSAQQMIVIGLLRAGAWEIYSQITGQGGALQAQRID